MAKRRKINQRVMLLLIALGVLIVAGVAGFYISHMEPGVDALISQAEDAVKNSNHEEAAKLYARAAKTSRKPEHWFLAAQEDIKVYEDENMYLTKRIEKRDEAYRMLQNALREDPQYVAAMELVCDIDWNKHDAIRFLENIDKLIEVSPEDNPNNHLHYYRRGIVKADRARTKRGKLVEEAISDINKAIELKPDDVFYRLELIKILRMFKGDEDVEKAYVDSIAALENNAELRSQYAMYLWKQGRKDEANEQILQARERQPDSAISYLTQAGILLREPGEENRANALNALQEAKKAEPGNPAVYFSTYQILLGEQKREDAINELREGLAATEKRIDELSSEKANAVQVLNLRRGREMLLYYLTDSLLDSIRLDGGAKDELLKEAHGYMDKMAEYGETPQRKVLQGRIAAVESKGQDELANAVKMVEEGCEALDKIEKSPGLYVKNARALYGLYIDQGRPQKAEDLLNEILEKYPDDPPALIEKAKLLITNQRNYDEAERYLKRVLEVQEDNAQAAELLTQIRIQRGTLDPSRIELTSGTIISIVNRARQAMAAGHPEQATSMLEDLHRRLPDDLNITRELISMYISRDMMDQAENLIQAVLDSTDDPEVVSEFQYTRDMIREKDPEKRFQMRMERADTLTDPVERALSKALACQVYNKEDDYLKYLKEAAEAGPNDPKPTMLLFSYGLIKKNWEMAEEYLAIIKEKNFDSTNGELSQAGLDMAKGSYDKAITILEPLLAKYPQMKRARIMIGRCYLETNRLEEAKEAFQNVVDNDPSFEGGIAIVGMAQVTERMQNAEEHWQWIRQAQKMAPNNSYIRNQVIVLKELEAKKEDLPALIARREEVMAKSPEDMDNLMRLADLYLRNGQTEKAGEIYAFLYNRADVKYKITFAKLLATVYLELDRKTDIDALFADLLSKTDNKSEAYRLYGTLLQGYDPERAEKIFDEATTAAPDDFRPYVSKAAFYHATGRLDEAIKAMQEALKRRKDENGKRALKRDIVNLMLQGKWDIYKGTIESYVNSLLSDAPDDISALALKGAFLYRQALLDEDQKNRDRDLEKAGDAVTRAIQINRDYVPAYTQRARIYVAMGNWASARADLKTAFNLCKTPDSIWVNNGPTVGMELVALEERLENIDAAIETCQEIQMGYPDYLQAVTTMISLYLSEERWDRAEAQIRDASEKYPKNWVFPLYEAKMWRLRKDIDNAKKACTRAYELAPQAPAVVGEYVGILLDAKNYQEAFDLSEQFVGQDGFNDWLEAMRARANVGLGNAVEGEDLFKETLKKTSAANLQAVVEQIILAYGSKDAITKLAEWQSFRPNDAMLRVLLADLYWENGDLDKTIEALQQALKLAQTPESKAFLLARLGRAYNAKDMVDEAKKAYLECLEYNSWNAEVLNNLAYLYVDNLNDPESALEYAKKAIQILPNEPNVIDTYGWVLAKQGNHREAQEIFVKGLNRKPAVALRYHYGWSLEQTGNLDEALAQFEQGFELVKNKPDDPLYDKLKEAVQRVKKELE